MNAPEPVDPIAGELLVSHDGTDVVVSHTNLEVNDQGEGWIRFSPRQARHLAQSLLHHAAQLEFLRGRQGVTQ